MNKENSPIVKAKCGKLEGTFRDGLFFFRGIPYAHSLAGKNMWLPPQRVPAWDGIRRAASPGPSAPQSSVSPQSFKKDLLKAFLWVIEDPPWDYDALNLNIVTPSLESGARLPVMVWIHSGGFSIGSGNNPVYNGRNLARHGIVYVSFNYRLDLPGGLEGESLFDGDFCASNRPFLDQIALLEWVNENIEAFGGDPGNVTITGESAGASSAMALSVSPRTDGLFRRVIAQSGTPKLAAPLEEREAATRFVLKKLGISPGDSEALSAVPIKKILKLSTKLFFELKKPGARKKYGSIVDSNAFVGPTYNTSLFPEDIISSAKQTGKRELEFILGTNRDESRLWSVMYGGKFIGPRLNYFIYKKYWGREYKKYFKSYRKLMPDETKEAVMERFLTDALFRRDTIKLAEALVPGNRVYLYRFDRCSPSFEGRLGALHSMEIPFVFDTLENVPLMAGPAEDGQPLADMMNRAWVNFARDGVPSAEGLPGWASYNLEARPVMLFDNECSVVEDPDKDFRGLWI